MNFLVIKNMEMPALDGELPSDTRVCSFRQPFRSACAVGDTEANICIVAKWPFFKMPFLI